MKRTTKRVNLQQLSTEKANTASAEFDWKSSLEIARIINSEDAKVAAAVARSLPQIAQAIDWIAAGLAKGGRLIYVGTGTSGRIAALDAAECPPTFNTDPKMVQFIIAGGSRALAEATEASEDSRKLGREAMAKKKPAPQRHCGWSGCQWPNSIHDCCNRIRALARRKDCGQSPATAIPSLSGLPTLLSWPRWAPKWLRARLA